MINKKIKICLLAMVMMLGVSTIAAEEPAVVSETAVQTEENEQIKANRETFEKAQDAINKKDYQAAAKIADTVDWRRVKNLNMCTWSAKYMRKRSGMEKAWRSSIWPMTVRRWDGCCCIG